MTLPVFILAVVALTLIINIISLCESISFFTALETHDIDVGISSKINSITLCKKIENRIRDELPAVSDFQVKKVRCYYSENNITDLISFTSVTNFEVNNIIGIDGKINFEEKLLTRAFTGTLQTASPLDESAFTNGGASVTVVVFPRYGIRYHVSSCRYVTNAQATEEHRLEMEQEDAKRKGYTPCLVCGGGSSG